MNHDEPQPAACPTEALKNFARCLVTDGAPDAYQRFRDACDAAILAAAPAMAQTKFAAVLGMSRTTLRSMIRRLGLSATDGRRVP